MPIAAGRNEQLTNCVAHCQVFQELICFDSYAVNLSALPRS